MTVQRLALNVACARMRCKQQTTAEGMRHGQRTTPCASRCAALTHAASLRWPPQSPSQPPRGRRGLVVTRV
eukprot:6752139-Pyramimonas_sp.AAC.1